MTATNPRAKRIKRSLRARARLKRHLNGRARLAVFRSSKNIYAQIIDDEQGITMVAASSVEKDLKGKTGATIEAASAVGKLVAERAKAKGIENVTFDRGGFLFHGRVKALADAAREAGLSF